MSSKLKVLKSYTVPSHIATNTLTILKARPTDLERDGSRLPQHAQLKHDGHRLLVYRHPLVMGSLCCYTTSGHNIASQLQHCEWFSKLERSMCYNEMLDCELVPTVDEATGVRGGAEEVKHRIANRKPLDLIAFATSSLPASASVARVDEELARIRGVMRPEYITLEDGDNVAQRITQWVTDRDAEGVVLKRGNFLDWRKWKRVQTIDLIVTDTTEGDGRFIGLIGSLVCSLVIDGKPVVIANVSGMDDRTRIMASDEAPIGRVCEVRYDRVGTQGKLRHPRFVRWRPDKSPAECSVNQDPKLEKIIFNKML